MIFRRVESDFSTSYSPPWAMAMNDGFALGDIPVIEFPSNEGPMDDTKEMIK